MATLFYDHLLVIEDIVFVLDSYHLTVQEKKELMSLIDETLNHHILDVILKKLPKKHHKEFLSQLSKIPHSPELLQFLKQHARGDIEKQIIITSNNVKKLLIQTIHDAKK